MDDTSASSQPIPSQAQTPPSSDRPITLDDLYGPSQSQTTPVQPNTQPVQPQPQENPPEQIFQPQIPIAQENTLPQDQDQSFVESFTPQPEESNPVQQDTPSQETVESGGFHFPPILKYVIGGLIAVVILIFLISLIKGLFQSSSTGKVTLTYWGLWESPSVMSGVISNFERIHPTISINYIQEDPKEYTQRLLTRIQQGNGPDIFRFHNSWVTPLQSVLLPLPQNVLDKTTLEEYPPVVTQDLVKNGAMLGLPMEMDTLSLFVNKDIFDHAGAKVPTTWDDFIVVSKALTVKDATGKIKTAGAAMGAYNNIDHAPDIISLLFLQNGANLTSLANSQNAVDALNFYTQFGNGDNRVWDSTLNNSIHAFAQGNVAMVFGYSWDVLAIQALAPSLHFAVYNVPHLSGRNITIASYWNEGISAKTTHPKEAAEFLSFLAQKDTQAQLYSDEAKTRLFGELYAREDLAQSLASSPLLSPFITQAKNAVSTFFIGATDYDEFNGALNQYLANAINSILGNTSVNSALATLSQGVAQVLNQYAQPTP